MEKRKRARARVPFLFKSVEPAASNSFGPEFYAPAISSNEALFRRPKPRRFRAEPYAPALFEKLDTAAASVSYTSKTVSSLVICSTSWNLLPRWHSRSDAPCDFAL
jgi:hypothetical protein